MSTTLSQVKSPGPVFPFRPLFLCAAGFAALGMFEWAAFLHLGWLPPSPLPPVLWHAHEMLFGFGGALIGGFLLTASANWTALPTTSAASLALITGLWLAARLVLMVPGAPLWVAGAAGVGYFLVLAALLARVIVRTRNRRNFFVIGIVLLFAGLDAVFYWGAGESVSLANRALLGCVDVLALLMVVMGGRVIPFFSRRRLAGMHPTDPAMLRTATNLAAFAALAADLTGSPAAWRGALWLAASALVAARLAGWDSLKCRNVPMLWVLHLGYLWLAVGMALRGLGLVGVIAAPEAETLHGLTIGALGTLSLGMMVRVAQGHSGVEIRAGRGLTLAFVLPSVAAALRLAGGPGLWPAAGLLWTAAFAIYLAAIGPLLWYGRPTSSPALARQN